MGELFNKIAEQDRAIADRWKARTNEDLTRELQLGDIDAILGPVFRGRGKITERQGKALILFLEPSTLSREAGRRLRTLVDGADEAERWSLVPLITDHELGPIYKALSSGVVGRIIFKSPGTKITYAPFDYLAIARLISGGKVSVFESRVGGLSRAASSRGFYVSRRNRLVLNEFTDPDRRTALIVHEVTHAIQDWKDIRSTRHFIEADAFIAEAVAARVLRGHAPETDRNKAIPDAAARLVLDGNVDEHSTVWTDAYTAVVGLMAQFYDNGAIEESRGERGAKESDIYKHVVSAAETTYSLTESVKSSSAELAKSMAGIDLGKYVRK